MFLVPFFKFTSPDIGVKRAEKVGEHTREVKWNIPFALSGLAFVEEGMS
jgi:hypothetical protein